jgi:Domain of unknown function (DUF4180)
MVRIKKRSRPSGAWLGSRQVLSCEQESEKDNLKSSSFCRVRRAHRLDKIGAHGAPYLERRKDQMTENPNILVAADSNIRLESAQDIPDLIGACWGMDGVILHESDLSSNFFDLRTGLLGELFQKCTNYELRLAMVLLEPALHGERFSELIHEHRTHKLIQFFVSIDEAKTWLSVQ